MTDATPLPSAAAIRAYLDASGWTRHSGPSWSRDGRCVDAPDWLAPDLVEEVLAVIAQAEGVNPGDVIASVRGLAEASVPAKECGCSQLQPCAADMDTSPPVAAAFGPADFAALKRTARILANIVARNHQAMEAARIEMRQNGPHAGMQWVLNSLPDQWDDEETKWDGVESAQAWFDRTEAFYRAAESAADARTEADPGEKAQEHAGASSSKAPDPRDGMYDWPEEARLAALETIDARTGPHLQVTAPLAMYVVTDILNAVAPLIRAAERERAEAAEARLAEIRAMLGGIQVSAPEGVVPVVAVERVLAIILGSEDERRG